MILNEPSDAKKAKKKKATTAKPKAELDSIREDDQMDFKVK
jgi:hypothetical protein